MARSQLRTTTVLLALALLALTMLGCRTREQRAAGATAAVDTTPPAAVAEATAAATSTPPANTVTIHDPAERAAVTAALAEHGAHGVTVSERPIVGGTRFVVRAWAAVTGQRSDVLALSRARLRAALEGRIDDWADLGGAAAPLTVAVPSDDAELIERLFAPGGLDGRVVRAPATALVPPAAGTLAIVPIDALAPGTLPLVVDGHDPLRDPARTAPLRAERWVLADAAATTVVADALGWGGALAAYDPAGVIATGDYLPARCAWAAMDDAGDPAAALEDVRPLLLAADLAILELEVGLADSTPTECIYTFTLQGPTSVAPSLAAAGIDVVTRAANHAFDCWDGCAPEDVRAQTDAALEDAGVAHVGTGEDAEAARAPAVIEAGGVRFAVLAYDDIARYYHAGEDTPGVAGLDLDTLAEDVTAAVEEADHVIVSVHWGVEYTANPTDRQRAAARVAAEAGASLIVGNHPHWVQAVERIEDTLVLYALGNFVFDQSWSEATQQGVLLEVGFTPERMLGFRLRPIEIRDQYRPVPIDPGGEVAAAIFARIWIATDALPAMGGAGPRSGEGPSRQ